MRWFQNQLERASLYRHTESFFFQAEDGIRDIGVTGVQTCALPIWPRTGPRSRRWWWPSGSAGPGAGRRPRPGGRPRSGRRRRPGPRSCGAPLPLLLGPLGLLGGEPAGGADPPGGVEGQLDQVAAGGAVDLETAAVVALAGRGGGH